MNTSTTTPDLSVIEFRRIEPEDISDLLTVISETITWLNQSQEKSSQWSREDISEESLLNAHANDEIYIGYHDSQPVCSIIVQQKDHFFWQGANHDEALYINKLAVTKDYRGSGLAEILVDLATQRANQLGRYYIRLACPTNREKLCKFFTQSSLGFQHKGDIMVGNNTHSLYQKTN
ncbi:MAG: GNAT family N-acetyltransferase [Akkermansiaceae bacterium]